MPSRDHARSAFTLLEAIVVTAIIGVLVGLIIPAVQAVRESANRTSCANNLRQIGIGFHQFDNENGGLPSSFGEFPHTDSDPSNTSFGSAFFQILPYIGESPLFQSSDTPRGYLHYDSSRIKGKDVKIYICPSDPLRDRPGLGNYVANQAIFRWDVKPKYRLSTIPDGASKTIICTETICRSLVFGQEAPHEWVDDIGYVIHGGLPIHISSLREWNGMTSSPHWTQPVLNADGAVHHRAFPIDQTRWNAASDPGDGRGWSTDE